MKKGTVGFFDSGIGGTCILDAFRKILPNENTVYFADRSHCPYGNKTQEEVLVRADAIANFLIKKHNAKMIVVACNTATAAAIDYLREKYQAIPFVGIEPAIKPAILHSKTKVVGVLATQGTFNGRLYKETAARFANGTNVIATVADEFVTLVEEGELEGERAEKIVREKIEPLLSANADHIVLGCTHFPHLMKVMKKVINKRAKIVEPSKAVALRAKSLLEERNLLNTQSEKGDLIYLYETPNSN
ncbi:MAG: glutamate racemase [Kiritimatiellae bacterium]|nr:glutamate racemase [Kiritimatiellia bacterium]